MSKLQLGFLLVLISSFSLSSSQAVPSLLCIPKTTTAAPHEISEVAGNRKSNQTTTRRIRVYYVNAHSQWEAKALVINDQVKAIIFRGKQGRPFAKSKIDSDGFGSGIDFRGMPWEFRGFLNP